MQFSEKRCTNRYKAVDKDFITGKKMAPLKRNYTWYSLLWNNRKDALRARYHSMKTIRLKIKIHQKRKFLVLLKGYSNTVI